MMKIPFDAREMARIRSTINPIELLTPTNYAAEKQKWLDSGRKFFNPQFTYDKDAIRDSIKRIDLLAPLLDLIDGGNFYDYFKAYGRFAHEALKVRYMELHYLSIFLSTLLDERFMPGDHYLDPLRHLYGDINPDDVKFAELLIKYTPEEAYAHQFIWSDIPTNYDVRKYKRFFDETLRSLKGMFSEEEEKAKLKKMEFNAEEIAGYFQFVLDYMRENASYNGAMAREEEENPTYYIEISPKYTAVSVNAFSTSGKSVIGIPADRKVNGLKLVELVGHELNSHYRSAMSTRAYFRNLLNPYDDTCPILPLIPMMSHSLDETLSEGLAKLNDIRVSGKAGFPKPYQVLAIDFVQHGHNFKETMEYVFELTRQNHKTENTALNNAWNYTYRIFRGQRDTSSKCGYAFPKDKVYLSGFLTVVRNAVSWNSTTRHFEPFLNLLRYSTLTLEELDSLDSQQSGVDYVVGHDSYPQWKYNGLGFYTRYVFHPDPVEYAASLLLN